MTPTTVTSTPRYDSPCRATSAATASHTPDSQVANGPGSGGGAGGAGGVSASTEEGRSDSGVVTRAADGGTGSGKSASGSGGSSSAGLGGGGVIGGRVNLEVACWNDRGNSEMGGGSGSAAAGGGATDGSVDSSDGAGGAARCWFTASVANRCRVASSTIPASRASSRKRLMMASSLPSMVLAMGLKESGLSTHARRSAAVSRVSFGYLDWARRRACSFPNWATVMPRAAGWMTFPQAGQRSSSGVTSSRQWWQITKSIGHSTGSRIVDGGFMRPVCSRMTTLNMGDAPQPDFGVCARGRSFLRNLDFRSLAGHGSAGPMTVRLAVVLALLITPPSLGPPESDPSPTDWCRQSPRRAPKGTSRDQRVGRHAQRRCGIQPPVVLPANCWNIPARITSLAERVESHSAYRGLRIGRHCNRTTDLCLQHR